MGVRALTGARGIGQIEDGQLHVVGQAANGVRNGVPLACVEYRKSPKCLHQTGNSLRKEFQPQVGGDFLQRLAPLLLEVHPDADGNHDQNGNDGEWPEVDEKIHSQVSYKG